MTERYLNQKRAELDEMFKLNVTINWKIERDMLENHLFAISPNPHRRLRGMQVKKKEVLY